MDAVGSMRSKSAAVAAEGVNPLTWITEGILLSDRHQNGLDPLLCCLCAVGAASFKVPYLAFRAKNGAARGA